MSASYKIRHENSWYNNRRLYMVGDDEDYNINNWYSSQQSDPGSERSNRNGHSGKDGMAYGGLAYYDNALYTGPHSYKCSFSGNPDYPDPDTYRRKKSRCLVALIVIGLLLVVGIAVFLGVYFGVMEKTDKVDPVLQTEPGKFQGTLKMNNNWDPKYGDNTTPEFTNLKTDLENQLTSMYQNSALNNDFNKVTVTGFSPGSIVGVYILELKATTVQTQNSVLQITVQAVQDVQADAGSSSDLIKAVNTQEIVIAAVLVTTTLQPPVTTTQAPVTTTQAPVTTTQAPATTTQAPVTTTQAPVTTTQPPATTTHAPITTTQPPDTTTQAPVTTTQPPVTTTQAPATTTQPPDTTTQPPVTTTQPPDTTTQPPDTTTQPPVTTTQPLVSTTQAPDTTTQPPVTTTQPPVTTTQAPDTTTQPPVTTTQPPVTTTQPPVTTTQPPVTTTQAPDTTTQPPDTTTQPPVTTTQPPDTTTKAPVTTTQPPATTTQAPTTTAEAPVTSTPPPATTTTTPADENPCVDYSLLEPIAINCISKHGQALIAETTTEGKCRVLLDDVITCVVSDIHTQYNKTCTEKEQHNIIINNKDTIETIVRVNPVLCLPEASCMNIRAITYFIPIICEDQINLLRSSGNCSDFSDALKCYYYHTRIKYTCDLDTFMMTVTNNYTALVTDIGKPDLTCPVDTSRIDSSVKASLCQDPDVMQVIVDMYCPHDLRDFIQASSGDKCMYGHNLVVCIVQQMTSVFNTTCMTDDIYQQMKIYQSQIIGVSDQLNIQSCQGTTPMTTEPMTTTMTMTTTVTIVEVKGEFEANLKINATWDPKYEDKNSTEYNDLTEKFRNQTLSMYKNSSLEVEDIIIKEVRQGSVYFIFIIVFKKDAANIDSLTPEIVKEVTKKIIETIQENPSDSFDLIQNTAVAEIAIIQVTEILTECDRVPYIKSIVEKYCDRSQQQLKWAIQPQEQCRIFLQMTGCVMFFTRTCSAKKITRTISSNLNDFVENMPGFDPRICYDEDNVVLPTMMPVTAPVKSCAHPDVLSYILNFDCNYDAIPSHFEQAASTSEQCRFYWQSSACVYDNIKNNPVLQGTCSYDEITDVLQKYEAQIYRVHPMNVNASVCFAYDRDPNKCSSMLYDPDMYGHFRDCFYNIWGIRMNQDVDTSAVTCVLYEESFECVYRFYQQKGLDSCNKAVLEKDVIWMTNSINSLISKRYGQNFTEPDVVQTCIGNSSSDPDFGQSLCHDGVGILTANAECIDRYITAVKTGSLSVCSGLKNVFIPCVMEKIAKIDNCSAADMMASVIKEKDLVLTMSSGNFDISKCDEAVGGDVCTTYNTSIIATAVQCSRTLTATANKANAGHAFCSAYNVFLRCVHIIIEKTTGKPCAKSSLDVWMPYVTDAYTNFTKEDAQACIVTDDNDDDMCHDIKTLEDMALYSQCGVSYIPYFKTSSDCRTIIEPYFKCLSEMFPSCDIKEIARKLMTSTTFTDKLQPGFDVLTCLKDDVLDGDICATYNISIITTAVNCAKTLSTTATRENAGHVFCSAYNVYLGCVQYVIEEKTGKTCTKMSLDMWMPYLVPASTNFTVEDAQACNVTDDGMCPDVRTLEVMATYSVCSLYVQYLKMYPDCRTIIEPYFKCLAEMFPACNVTDLAKTLMMSQHFADKLPSESTLLGCLKGSEDGSDICASFNANLTGALTQCGGATYGFMIGSAPKYAFCSAYNTYVNCIHSLIEENTGKTCKRSSLDTWLPYTISLYINVTSEEIQACNVTEDDVDDDVICNDVITIEEMAYYSSCGGYFSVLTSNPDCGLVVKPYMECLAGLFPSCDAREIAKTLLTSPTFTAQIPQGIDILDCIGGADICQNYTDIVRNITECSVAVSGFKDKETHIEFLCRGYDVYISCLEVTIHKMGKGCEERSLRTWIPQYMEKSFNLSASTVMTCNVTYTDPHLWCTDIRTLEMMAIETPCGHDFEMLAVNPNCLSAEKFLNCMEGMFPECDGKTLVQNMLMSPLLRNKIPLHFDPMTCFTEGPPSGRFEVTVKLNETFDDKLHTNNSDERRNFILQFEKEVQDLFKGTGLENETNKIFVTDVRPGSIIVVFEIWLKMGSIYYSTLRAEDLRQQIVQKIKQIQDGPQTKPSYLFSVVVDDIFVKMIVTTDDVTTTTSPTPTIAPDCNSVEYIKQFATMHCDAARNQLTLVQNSKQCSVFLDMVGCIMFNSMKCSAEEVVRTLNRDLWGIIGKNVTGFDSTTCYVSEDNIVFPTIVPETAPLIPCKNPHVLRYILNYNCYYDGLENFMQGNMPLESCRIYWFSSSCVYGYTKENAMLGNCSYQDITDVLEKYDEELYLVRPVDVNASVCFEYDRKQDKCSTMLYDPTHYALFFDCYSNLLTTRMNPLLNSTGLDCLLYEENLECGFRFYEQIGIGWCDKMQFEKDWIWYTNGLDGIMTKATGTPLGQPDVVERCIANASMAPDFGMYFCRDIKGLILSNVLCIHRLQYTADVCSSLRTEYIPCLKEKADDYKMMCSNAEDFLWNGLIQESDLIKHLTWNYVDISKCNTANKTGECPPVANHTGGGCVEECSADWQCTGNQKCCSNGCGHTCVDPSPETMSKIFEITFRFDIPWKSEYRNGTGYMMLTTKISDQLNSMVYNSTAKDVVDYMKIIDVRQGSVLVTIVIGFNQYLTPDDVRQTTINLVKAVQEQPPSSSNDLIQKIDLTYLMVSEHRDGPITTTSPPIGEDCHSVKYIKQFVTSQCDSARNQLTKVENSKRCSVFLDLVGCVVFQSQKCSIDEVMMTLNKDIWGIIGQNITGFDPVTCYGSGSQIVLPTIMPLNTTLKPCIHPDVLNYVLKYDCYYTALEQQMNGDTELESCRFYWYSSSCVYGALKDNAMMGNCSYQEIAQVLQMYENQLYMISPKNVNASVCFDYDRSTELCSTFLYDPYSYHYFYDCYSSGYINRNNWALDVSSVGCMIYEESYECMYRFYKQKWLGSCDRMQFEEDVIWLTNSMNDIMSQSTGTPPDSKDTVKMCIANVSHTPDFGQDLCEDGPGLIMADTVCLIYLQYIPDKCSGIKTTYLPCLLRKTVDYRMACSEDMVYASIMKESDLILNLTMNRVDISKCDQDEDKIGECPSVRNDTVGICLQNCTYDKECTGNQKCCSNGCGHVCVEPVSKVFKMTFRFNITWDSDYGDENSTKRAALTAGILYQVNKMVANSHVKDLVEWLKIIGIREGSVYVDFLIGFITELTADDVQQTTVMLVQTVQANSTSPLDKIKSINTDDIHVTIYKGTETDTDDDDDDDCSDYNRITTEFMTCSVYIIRFTDMSDSDLDNCGLYNYFIDCVINTVSDVGKTCREDSLRKWMPIALANMRNPALEGLKNCPGYVDGVCKDESIIQHIFMTACNYTLDYIATRPCQVIQETVTTCMLPSMPGSRCTGDQIGSTLLKSSQITDRLQADFDPTSCGYSGIEGSGSCPTVTTVGVCVENCTSNSSCTGGQKCCFNGCGHVCMDPVSNMTTKRFQITFRINITWTEAYRYKNSTEYVTLQTNLKNQLNQMLSNSPFKDIVEYIKVIDFRPGSVMAVCELKLTEGKPLDDVKSGTRQIILQEQQKDPSPDNLLQAVDPNDIHVITLTDLEDVCTDMSKISAEMASCYVYLLYIVSPSNAENCGMYNYYLDCIKSKVTENGQRCEGDSLRLLMTTFIPTLQKPELGYILNCPDYTDGICDDRAIIELIFNDKCTSFLPAFTTLPTCKAFETIIDSCMNFAMPGSRCDKSAMLSALSSISVIADKIPQDFNISSCSDPFASSNCRTYGHGMDKPEVLECMMPFYDVNIDDLPPDVRCRMYDALINCMNVQITADGVICDVPSLHTWLPDYFGQLKVNPDLLRNCTVGRINSTTFCTDMNILEEFGNYSSCRALLQNFSSNPSCGSATTAFQCFEYILPQCDFMVVIQMMMSSPVFQSYIPPGFNIMACAPANNDTTPSPSGKLKNGTCPKISHGDGSTCADECTSDSSCPGDQKCCSDECGLKCMDPEDDTDKDSMDTCFGSWGSCVSTTNCHMVMWSYNTGTDLISFNITAAINPDTWIAIGFNKEAKMVGTDAIVSWITTDGKVTVTDRIITSYVLPPLDADPEQDILDIEGYRKDGLTNIMFRRPLTTANPAKDFQFSSTNCAYFIYAIGGNYNDGDKSITKHSNTPTISTDKICLPCSGDVCTDIATFKTIAATTCKPLIDQFSSSDSLIAFCLKLNNLDACVKGALPTYGCPNEIATEVYPKLLGLLDQLLGFSASSMALQCSS